MQRRQQKLIEKSPAPGIPREAIPALGRRCAITCREIGYVGAGTFEFVDEDGATARVHRSSKCENERPGRAPAESAT
jgi:acetyl-CoA carboxylase biotin carboxylase subunit